jgi:nucleoside-diphosphate-sugar epimerase
MSTARAVLVTGATGSVGPAVVHAFRNAGFRIRVLVRQSTNAVNFPVDVEVCVGDVTDSSAMALAMRGIDRVVHMAALLHVIDPPDSLQEEYERVNVGGTANVVRSAAEVGVQRVLYVSTIAVYGQSCGEMLTEDHVARPDTFYAKTKLAAEQIVLAAKRADGKPLGTVLRLAAVYGPRIRGNYRRLLLSLASRRFVPIGKGMNRRTLVYDEDVAAAAVLAMQRSVAAGRVYNVSDGEVHTLNEIIRAMCDALGRRAPRISIPIAPVDLAARLSEFAARMFGSAPLLRQSTITKYTEDIAVSSELIKTELGFSPAYTLAAGWRQTVKELRLANEL